MIRNAANACPKLMKDLAEKITSNFRRRKIAYARALLNATVKKTNISNIVKYCNHAWRLEGKPIRILASGIESGIFKICHINEAREIYVTSISRAEWLYEAGFNERGLQLARSYAIDKVRLKDGDLVIDCGANYGDLNLYFEHIGIEPDYFGIEPSPLDYNCLLLNWGKNGSRKTFDNIALGDENKILKFFLDTENASSSLIMPRFANMATEVNCETLDSFCKRHRIENRKIKLLKLEAEGAEPEICLGMEETLKRTEYLAADLGPERGAAEECTAPFVINFLLARGFVVEDFGDRVSLRMLFKNTNW